MCGGRRPTVGCRAHSEAADGEPVSAVMDAELRAAGLAAVADPPAQAGGDPDTDQERIAASGFEPWRAEEERPVERSGRAYLETLPLAGWTARRREDLLSLLGELDRHVDELDQAVKQAACEHPQARLLMTQRAWGRLRRWRLC